MTTSLLAPARVPRSLRGRRGWGSPSLHTAPATTLPWFAGGAPPISPYAPFGSSSPLGPPLPAPSRWGPRRSRECCAQGTPSLPPSSSKALAGAALTRAVWTAVILVLLFAIPAVAAQVSHEQVREIAFQLRCVVCQNLSVADSPSETASQMRQIIRERLALGESREQILDYFVSKYGEWILLSPPRRGFNLVVWGLPFAGLLAGLVTIAVVVRRWSRSRREEPAEVVDPAYRDRVRRELQELDR